MLSDTEVFSRLDLAFGRFLAQRANVPETTKPTLGMLLTRLSQQQRQGHNCLEISEEEKALLTSSDLVTEQPAIDTQHFPLVIEKNRLYLQRYWCYEDNIVRRIQQLVRQSYSLRPPESLLDRYFGMNTTNVDWQREAAKLACNQDFCIITGGPGTGKTTTVCKILALLQELAPMTKLIVLAAPTGKAAMRLQTAILQSLSQLECSEAIKKQVPTTALTLHRLLGAQPASPYFKHDVNTPLVFDIVVIDEASMVDLALLSKLMDALKPGAKLILLGDKDQLASVESGAILADLITSLPGNTIELKQAFRYGDVIKNLAETVNQQEYEQAWDILTTESQIISLVEQQQLMPYIVKQRANYSLAVKSNAPIADIFAEFNRFQVLCANRHGDHGALAISRKIELTLFDKSWSSILPTWYPGRPVMVLENNAALGLYNGDIGICLLDREQNNKLMVFFQRSDGSVKTYLPARMTACETMYAMTIHKSQGSEYDSVLILLPEVMNPVLSKELLYTAITRARKYIAIATKKDVFTDTISKKVSRLTGVTEKFLSVCSPKANAQR